MPQLRAHWKESGQTDMGDFDIDRDVYETLYRMKLYLAVGVKKEGKVVAYMSIFMFYHPHVAGLKVAQTDCFYVDPAFRGLKGYSFLCKMVKEAEHILKTEYKVKALCITYPEKKDLFPILGRLGYKKADVLTLKKL